MLGFLGRLISGVVAILFGIFALVGFSLLIDPKEIESLGTNGVMFLVVASLSLLFGWLAFRRPAERRGPPAYAKSPETQQLIERDLFSIDQTRTLEGALIARGAGGTIEFDGREVKINRQGVSSFLIHGLAGEKSIMLPAIQAVQFRPAKGLVRGYLQMTVLGGIEARGGAFNAAGDENSVLFDESDQPAFERISKAIKDAIHARSSSQQTTSIAMPVSAADELAKFANLKEKGIIDEAEFAAKKAELLSRG